MPPATKYPMTPVHTTMGLALQLYPEMPVFRCALNAGALPDAINWICPPPAPGWFEELILLSSVNASAPCGRRMKFTLPLNTGSPGRLERADAAAPPCDSMTFDALRSV